MKNTYRVGRKNKVTILSIETGEEIIQFPNSNKENVQKYCNFLNEKYYLETSLNNICFIAGIIIGMFSMLIVFVYTN